MVERIGWLTKIFSYDTLLARLADRDAQIVSLKVEVQELRDRLFLKHGYTASGDVQQPLQATPPYRTGRQRLHDMVRQSVVGQLSAEDEKMIEGTLTQ